ncbi:MAG: acyl-CoA thioesterase [Spirochaetes bacterium]|nr:acyl-CoA thioesterase [Spirochaetota bacterium]
MGEKARTVSASCVEMAEIVQPMDINIHGSIFGGHLMSLVDKAGGIAACRHSGTSVVTLSVDHLAFKNPAPVGTILSIKASVNRVFRTSMEAGVRVIGWKAGSDEETLICRAYITYVAVDEAKKPIPVRPIVPETSDQIRRWEEAGRRREARLALVSSLEERR